jgi:hypothetical protein
MMRRQQATPTTFNLKSFLLCFFLVIDWIPPSSAALAGWISDGHSSVAPDLSSLLPTFRPKRTHSARSSSSSVTTYQHPGVSRSPLPPPPATTTTKTASSPLLCKLLPPLPEDFQARIYLVRHAETDWNAEGRVQGCAFDIGLNDVGRAQAHEAAHKLQGLPIGVIASSPLQRARTTADICTLLPIPRQRDVP